MPVPMIERCEDPCSFSNFERAMNDVPSDLDPDQFEIFFSPYRSHIDKCRACSREESVTIELEGRHICEFMGIAYKKGYAVN
jgi:hypothetical protein